jgi:phospholipid/cholesterol/gamma-HCH transport system substrate-binding protein
VKKTNMDLIVGGSILLSIVILISGVLWLKGASVSRKMVTYTAIFPNVGTLQVGDPVMINGVTKGDVGDIQLRGSQVAVILKIEKDVNLTDSCRVIVQNIGLMGERGIGVQYSTKGKRFSPNSNHDTTLIQGYFDTGIAEAMGLLGNVLVQVQDLTGNVSTILASTVGDTAFMNLFQTMVNRLDTITDVAQKLVVENKPLINSSVQNVTTVTSDLKNLLQRNSGHIDSIIANGDALTSYTLSIASKVDSLTTNVKTIVDKVNRGEGSLGMALKDEQFFKDVKTSVADLDTLVKAVKSDALKLRLVQILGFGKKKKE